jgi:hypothetical protein
MNVIMIMQGIRLIIGSLNVCWEIDLDQSKIGVHSTRITIQLELATSTYESSFAERGK